MKKIIYTLIIGFLIICPIKALARDSISNYYVEATVQSNGDLKVKELFVLDGTFNGFERIIRYRNSDLSGEDTLYNGSDIELTSIKALSASSNISFDNLYDAGTVFSEVSSASKGNFGVYTKETIIGGYSYLIYNPSSRGLRGFFLEYTIKNIGIVHNDVAEIYWNLFSDELNEYIDNMEIIVNIPNNEEEIRAWAHGPLTGEIDIISKTQIKFTITDLYANTALDVRFAFDTSVLKDSTKLSGKDVLDDIIAYETIKSDEANDLREEARDIVQREKNIGYVIIGVSILYFMFLIYMIRKIYIKYDKEHTSTFKTKYYRDIPNDYGPEIVKYLMEQKVDSKILSSSLLNLIADKFIKVEKIKGDKYKLVKTGDMPRKLTEAENKLFIWFLDNIGDGTSVNLDDIKVAAKKDYERFLSHYESWKGKVLQEAIAKNFFEDSSKPRMQGILLSAFGFFLALAALNYPVSVLIILLLFTSAVGSFVYFNSISKRTVYGNEEYLKWNGLKNFINDFGQFENRDLPQIVLWEKYLVYASVFDLAKKLSKTMKIKFEEINPNYRNTDLVTDMYMFNTFSRLNHVVASSVNSAMTTAYSAKSIAESRNSSGGGFGGGFSGGGGFGGGGGGGGRF
ncbi:MAG: DUF2207 domain-containing protein [Bacilli bacterium]|nr:DUF2207 domain-containing protein [Bacilli bacterium]